MDRRLGGPRTGLDGVEKKEFLTVPGHELRTLSRPARSQLLYLLRYLLPLLTNSVTLVHERTRPTERPPLVGEVSAIFCG
jgi:hypothetical protein